MCKPLRLVGIAAILLMLCTSPAMALSLGHTWVFTENLGPNSAGFGVGHHIQIGTLVDDLGGVPDNIASVHATALTLGQPDYELTFIDCCTWNDGMYIVSTPYTGQVGQWKVTVVNHQYVTAFKNTTILDNVHEIPLATNLQATGSILAPTITWDPVLFDHDNNPDTLDVEVDNYRVRLLNSLNDQFYRSSPFIGNSFTVPMGLIVPGQTYIRLEARHFDIGGVGDRGLENRSSTFMQSPVPEPTTMLLLGSGLVGLAGFRRKIKK